MHYHTIQNHYDAGSLRSLRAPDASIALENTLPGVYVLNGPNLNLLGTREPHLYGHTTLAEIEQRCQRVCSKLGLDLVFRQTNHEGQLVEWVHEAREHAIGIVINPAGYSFTSVALLDALKASELPVVEVHITNIHRRESIYHKSLVSLTALGVICGVGPLGYDLALTALAEHAQSAT
jgi:3-dehydroquinate dehydratase-2